MPSLCWIPASTLSNFQMGPKPHMRQMYSLRECTCSVMRMGISSSCLTQLLITRQIRLLSNPARTSFGTMDDSSKSVQREDGSSVSNGRTKPLCGSDWPTSKNLFAPSEVAEYSVAAGIDHLPAFKWWVPYILKKRNAIIAKVKSRYHN